VLIKYDISYRTDLSINAYNVDASNELGMKVFVNALTQDASNIYKNTPGLYNNNYYSVYSADNTNTSNPCKLLFDQISKLQPARFRDISNNDTVQPLPFIENDTISFRLRMYPASNQHLLTSNPPIPERNYQIKYHLKNNPITYERNLTDTGLLENDNFRAFIGQYGIPNGSIHNRIYI
jgi:hypothetical protein